MSNKSTSQNPSLAAAAAQPVPASAPKEPNAGEKTPVKEPQTDHGKAKVSEPKHADGKK